MKCGFYYKGISTDSPHPLQISWIFTYVWEKAVSESALCLLGLQLYASVWNKWTSRLMVWDFRFSRRRVWRWEPSRL